MKKVLVVLVVMGFVSGCGSPARTELPFQPTLQPVLESTAEPVPATPEATEDVIVSTLPVPDDLFSQMGITLPTPTCVGLTQAQTEGPYYIPDTPERNSLLEDGMQGTRLILVGYVLDQNCQPLANAWLDFWQADANGDYHNDGYRLRGHQFTDAQGRYYLETILPGLYSSRPIEHIHVKIKPEGGAEVTSQLYFPGQPIEGLTVTIEERDEYLVGYFNFVIQN